MDTSPEYINMCRQARELQEMWEPEPGDFYKLPGHFITCIVLKNSLIDMDAIWLPRIDQLITLSEEGWRQFVEMCDYETFNASPTLEIRGLERIMYIKYNKSWNGEDWI